MTDIANILIGMFNGDYDEDFSDSESIVYHNLVLAHVVKRIQDNQNISQIMNLIEKGYEPTNFEFYLVFSQYFPSYALWVKVANIFNRSTTTFVNIWEEEYLPMKFYLDMMDDVGLIVYMKAVSEAEFEIEPDNWFRDIHFLIVREQELLCFMPDQSVEYIVEYVKQFGLQVSVLVYMINTMFPSYLVWSKVCEKFNIDRNEYFKHSSHIMPRFYYDILSV